MKKKASPLKPLPGKAKNPLPEPFPPDPLKRKYSAGSVPLKRMPAVLDFPFRKYERIAKQVPFTQKEWAGILHLSEKTLQRYARDNKDFEGIYTDRILQMQELIGLGLQVFSDPQSFYRWLKRDKPVLGQLLGFDALKTSEGIGLLQDEIGRIMYGVYI